MQANTKFDDPSEAQLAEWTEQFSSASPFPHMVIDEFVANGHELSQLFPSEDWEGWNAMGDRYQAGKRSCDDIDLIPAGLREMIIHLNSPCTLRTLERITGIRTCTERGSMRAAPAASWHRTAISITTRSASTAG